MTAWDGEPAMLGVWGWWVVVTLATLIFGVRRWRLGAPGGRWAALAGLLGVGVGAVPLLALAGLLAAGAEGREVNDLMDLLAYRFAPVLWAASQLAVVAAVAAAWRHLDRARRGGDHFERSADIRSGVFQPPTDGGAVGNRPRPLRHEPAAGSRRYDPSRSAPDGGNR